jgi:hypothetical protein
MKRSLVALAIFAGLLPLHAQSLNLDAPKPKLNVTYIAEPATVTAGKPGEVELYFRIADGLHINSHSPADPTLIPTTLTLAPLSGVKVDGLRYPAGVKYAFSFAPREKLNVYTGDFVVKVRVTASQPGNFTLTGALRYQACDNLQCYPPKTAPVTVILTAK